VSGLLLLCDAPDDDDHEQPETDHFRSSVGKQAAVENEERDFGDCLSNVVDDSAGVKRLAIVRVHHRDCPTKANIPSSALSHPLRPQWECVGQVPIAPLLLMSVRLGCFLATLTQNRKSRYRDSKYLSYADRYVVGPQYVQNSFPSVKSEKDADGRKGDKDNGQGVDQSRLRLHLKGDIIVCHRVLGGQSEYLGV
jgi:hypothetical protein